MFRYSFITILLLLFVLSCGTPVPKPPPMTIPTREDLGTRDELAVIETDSGTIVFEFFYDIAPMHTANFKKLAIYGFYDSTTFHRIVPGFAIQGGDKLTKNRIPYDDGSGGPGWHVPAEFSHIKHEKGIVTMARRADPNSAGSQFMICLGSPSHLDGKYSVFGKVIKGLDVVEKIGQKERDPQKNALDPAVRMNKVRIVKRQDLSL